MVMTTNRKNKSQAAATMQIVRGLRREQAIAAGGAAFDMYRMRGQTVPSGKRYKRRDKYGKVEG